MTAPPGIARAKCRNVRHFVLRIGESPFPEVAKGPEVSRCEHDAERLIAAAIPSSPEPDGYRCCARLRACPSRRHDLSSSGAHRVEHRKEAVTLHRAQNVDIVGPSNEMNCRLPSE